MSTFPPTLSPARPGTAIPEAAAACLSNIQQIAGWSWELPPQLRRNDANQSSKEDVPEMKANLTGFFAGLRGWSATVKARPPPSGRPRVGGEHRRGR
jgi:hypothetical protein